VSGLVVVAVVGHAEAVAAAAVECAEAAVLVEGCMPVGAGALGAARVVPRILEWGTLVVPVVISSEAEPDVVLAARGEIAGRRVKAVVRISLALAVIAQAPERAIRPELERARESKTDQIRGSATETRSTTQGIRPASATARTTSTTSPATRSIAM
jgi:hypothetical protein